MASNEIALMDEDALKEMVYEIRDRKVMLDFDLARIYGYETKALNQQIQRNVERFPEEFRFKLNMGDWLSILRSQFVTANKKMSMNRSLPYAFTEQGVYMLMTVLKGDLAVRQSIALVKLFKSMKDRLLITHGCPSHPS